MLEEIRSRRSIRKYTSDVVDEKTIDLIMEMGTWAPSGLNNQPWKFIVIRDPLLKNKISSQTKYSSIIQAAPVCIAIFLDNSKSYDRVKDIQACGACAQNMLLTIHNLGMGGVWLGEILKNRDTVEQILDAPESCELMAVFAMGYTKEENKEGNRKPLEDVVLARK